MNLNSSKPHQNEDEAFLHYKRRFSLEKDFMNYSTDDLLFGILYHLATFHPEKQELYLTKKNFAKNKRIIRDLCGVSTQTLNRHIDKLLEAKLIKEENILMGEEKVPYPSYTFPYNPKTNYQLIENEMLYYIISTRNKQGVRIYIYLLNKYKWKLGLNEYYTFTNKDLMKAIGYSTNSNNAMVSEMITNVLESFKREGIIDYIEYYEDFATTNGTIVPTPKKRLVFVASSKSELD